MTQHLMLFACLSVLLGRENLEDRTVNPQHLVQGFVNCRLEWPTSDGNTETSADRNGGHWPHEASRHLDVTSATHELNFQRYLISITLKCD